MTQIDLAVQRFAQFAAVEKAKREKENPSTAFGAAAQLDWISNVAGRQFDRISAKSDPNFVLSAEKIKEYNKDLPPEWAYEFSGVSSDDEANIVRSQLLQRQKLMGQLQEAGWVGHAARFGANIVDPVAFAFGLASGGAGWISKGGRITRMAKAGLVASAGAVPIAAYQTSQDPDGEVADVLYNSAFAFALGSAGHGIGEVVSGRWAQKTMRELEARDLKALPPGEITEKAKLKYAEELKADPIRDAIEVESKTAVSESDTHAADFDGLAEAAKNKEVEIIDAEALDAPRMGDVEVDVPGTAIQKATAQPGVMGGGGASVPPNPPAQLPPGGNPLSKQVRTWRDFIANPVDSLVAMARVRWGISGRLGASEVPEMRMAASVYVQDSLARKGGTPAPYAGNTWVSREWRSHVAEIERESAQHIQSFIDSQKIPVHQRFAATEALQRAVSWELEGGPVSQVIPEAKAIADIHRRKYAELLEVAKRHGVPGFDKVPTNPDYFPHLHNVGAINDAIQQYGLKNIEDLYAKGMIADGWDPVDATKVAPGYVQALLNLGSYSDLDKIRLFAGDAETLKAAFKRFNIGLTDADAERIAKYLSPEDAGVNPRARRRVGLNTMVSSDLTDKNGNTTKLFLHQLIETNAQAVMHKYARQILGSAAESEILRAMSTSVDPSGATVFKTFDELRNHIKRQYQTRGVLTDRGRAKADLDRLTAIRKALVGIPLNDQSTFSDIARLIRAYNFIRGSGTFGIAQSVEFGKIVGEFGLEPIVQQWPAVGKLFSRAQNGELTNETLREIEALGMGAERITNQVTARFDDQIGIEEFGGKGLETALRRGEKLAGDVSLMVPVTIAQQRMAGLAAGQTILNLAMSGRPLSARRLADIGLDAPMWQRIVDQVKQHSTKDGVRLRAFNFDNWNDTEAAANLVASLDRWSRRVVQDSDIGSMSLWMTKPVGRIVIQFRTFALQSWEKQTLRMVQVRDARAFVGWALTGVLGSLAYVGQQYAGSLTDKEKRQKLKKNLSMKNIAAQGFARSGASSIMPSVIDTTGSFFGAPDPIFQSRYSGLSSRGLMSNPTFDLFDSGNQFARGLGRAMTGGTMTRGEARAGTKLLPFQNVVGIRNALDAMTDGLPRTKE